MIDKHTNGYVLICDECYRRVKYFDTWEEAAAYRIDADWRAVKHKGEWQHICPECGQIKIQNEREEVTK